MAMDFEANVQEYLRDRAPNDRYASFDYCFNYFQAHRDAATLAQMESPDLLQASCLQLGFYLASWGMYRGSTVLLTRSLRHLAPVIHAIVDAPASIWDVDADDYSPVRAKLVIDVAEQVRHSVTEGMTDTLVTKIMLGVFGCIPAWDTNFRRGFRVSTFSVGAMERVGDFYRRNSALVDRYRVPTLDFQTGADTSRQYPRAKVIDMGFFIEGA